MEHKFETSPKKKGPCPKCGTKAKFRYYEGLDREFGKCERVNECGYWNKPTEEGGKVIQLEPVAPKPAPIIIFPAEELVNRIVKRTKTCTSNFHKFCVRLTIPVDHLLKWNIYTDDDKTVFLLMNQQRQVVNMKWFRYTEEGKRDKSFEAYSLKQPAVETNQKYTRCLFGEHLLSEDKSRTVCVVESEKSAAMASFHYPQFDWVACGSASGLSDGEGHTADLISPLKGRKVWWLADADKAGRKNSSIANLKKHKIDHAVIDLFPEAEDGRDIADAIINGLRPEIFAPEAEEEPAIPEELGPENYQLPEGLEYSKVCTLIHKYSFVQHQKKMWMIRAEKGSDNQSFYAQQISNFEIRPLGHIESKSAPRRLLEIRNIFGSRKVLEVPTKAFTSAMEFTVFVEGEGNFQYNGVGMDLKKIRSFLYDHMQSFEEVNTLGWHKDGYFIFANGVYNGKFNPINEYGFVEFKGKKNFYIPALSSVNSQEDGEYEDEKKFIFVPREDVNLQKWSHLFCKVHKDNGKIAICHFMASLFRDFIYNRFKFFPHLFLFGPPGSGKSQVGWSIRALGFKGAKKPFLLSGGTKVAFHREFSHFVNFPCWFDEYDNSIDYDRIQALKGAYDGSGHTKSIKDSELRTKTVPVNSSCIISGQQLPIADNALFKRVILCQFHQMEYTKEETQLLNDLQDMEKGALTSITALFMPLRQHVEKYYMETFDATLQEFREGLKDEHNIEERIMKNMVIVVAMFRLLEQQFAGQLPFTYDEVKAVAIANIKAQTSLISNAKETSQFWDMVEFLVDRKELEEGTDYKIKAENELTIQVGKDSKRLEFTETTRVLYLRLSQVVPLYAEHFKRQNSSKSNPMDKGSLIHYLQHSKEFIGNIKSTRFNGLVSNAMAFDYEKLKAQGFNLERNLLLKNEDGNPADDAETKAWVNGAKMEVPETFKPEF